MSEKVFGFVTHPYEPVFDCYSKVLILGTIASPASRANGFYYTHPHNRFWKVLAEVFKYSFPESIEDKKSLLLKNNVALWDVLKSAYISGASDSSITDPIPNDLNLVIRNSDIKAVFTTGKKAYELYNKLCYPNAKINAICLPSTSPANCAYSFDRLVEEYSVILNYLR